MAGGHGQLLRRIPRINFPNRTHPQQHPPPPPPPPDAASQKKVISFFSNSKTSASPGGKASLQPKRTPVSEEEIESILKTPALVPTTIDGRMLLN